MLRGKGEIAYYKQFLLFQQSFQNTFAIDVKTSLVWERKFLILYLAKFFTVVPGIMKTIVHI